MKVTLVNSFALIAIINKIDKYHDVSIRTLEELLEKYMRLITTNHIFQLHKQRTGT